MSITINGVKPGTATLTIRAHPLLVPRPAPGGAHGAGGLPRRPTMAGDTSAAALWRARLCKTNQSPTPVGLLL